MKKGSLLKRSLWIAGAVVAVVFVVRACRGEPVLVDVGAVRHGPLQVTVDDDGFTRVRERYTISAPIQGRLLRPPLDPGDEVHAAETIVAEFVPVAPELLDPRTHQEAQARLLRSEAALHEAEARREQTVAELDYAVAELGRARELARRKIEPKGLLDQAILNEQRAREGLRAAEFAVQVARFELDLARASLREALPEDVEHEGRAAGGGEQRPAAAVDGRRLRLRSPITGKVLRVFEESARTLSAGAPILEVGNTAVLEVVADYLSQDAVKVRPGMEVLVEGWGGELPTGEEKTLRGRVRVVEPGGFTKTSALGVEEQRVNVIVDPAGESDSWAILGDGYRVELRVVLWEEDDVLIVPTGALFRQEGVWAVLVVDGATARAHTVQIGRRNGLEAQVLDGLSAGERVVLYPSDLVSDGTRVKVR